jgi:hypothetical protein
MTGREDEYGKRVGEAIRRAAGGVTAPEGLRARLASDRAARRRRPPAWTWAAAAVAVAALVALAVAVWPSSSGAPSPADAAAAALRPPDRPAPAVDPSDRRFVQASVGGVRFPNYAYDSAWRAVGARAETLGGRQVRVVVYARGAVRVGYAIVDGAPIGFPAGSRRADADGTPVWIARGAGGVQVVWERGGHTCVLASRAATLPQMLDFVSTRDEA